ncbi:hypothetical protein Tco_1473967 [Tanacetum coccineum]
MAEEQAIVYAPQWGNMTVDNVTFYTNNVLGKNYSFTKQVNSIQQLLAYYLITKTEVDIGEIIYSGLSYEREPDVQPLVVSTYEDVRAFLLSDDEAQESKEDILGAYEEVDEDSHTVIVSTVLFNRITRDHWEKHKEVAVHYANLKASIDEYYDENIAHRDQTDKLVEASMSSLDKIRAATSDLYKGLNIITDLLKDINNAIKDDLTMNKKISEATETFTKISTNITEVLFLVKGFDFSDLQSTVKDL